MIGHKNIIMRKRVAFKNELILHLFTQRHLKELFDLECVASEIQIDRLRLDNLAFDEENGCFVIIEYKNRFNANVLNQAQDYYNKVLEKPEKFSERLENSKNIDFNNTRVMIISPKFNDTQIKESKEYFELWQVSLYNDCCVEYKNLKTDETKTIKAQENELKLSEKDLLKNKTDEIRDLYHDLKNRVKKEFRDVECKILVDEISFNVSGRIICNVKFLKKSFNAYFFTEKLSDEKNRLRDISDIGTGGKANFELKINSKNDLNYFMELFKQVYNQKVNQ